MKKLLGQRQSSSKNIKYFLIAKGLINKPIYNWFDEINFLIYSTGQKSPPSNFTKSINEMNTFYFIETCNTL